MFTNFLASAPVYDFNSPAAAGGVLGAFMGLIIGFLIAAIIIGILVWIYSSFAYMAIAKKAKQSTPGLAWIPYIGPVIVAFKSANMHWWPWLLLIGCFIPILNIFASIIFAVYVFIWHWKLYEAVGKPGWWILLNLIPGVGLIIHLILIGITAWGK